MPDNFYSFFQAKNQSDHDSGFDYLFLTQFSRLYTVSFEKSVYAEFQYFPTLANTGYGIIFDYDQLERDEFIDGVRVSVIDPKIYQTIAEIIDNFLRNKPDNVDS